MSMKLLERAEIVIPLGSQTFSKSKVQYPMGASPLFLKNGDGGRVWDVDGNQYVDLVGALLPVILGYCDSSVDHAILNQMKNGISFSLATEIEIELAEKLVEIIPCAEMVRFGKNGSDATAAAIRLARAFTGRNRIFTCGYHGWQDWYIGATVRNKGIPKCVGELTHKVPFNDLNYVEDLMQLWAGEVAAIIIEPAGMEEPNPGYLESLKRLAHHHGALLIFDETITGFRFSIGGAQSLYGVIPDLATFGKAIANGMPLSAVVGRSDVMMEMKEIFFSSTFGGETLSIAAALSVIKKMEQEPVIDKIWATGKTLSDGVEQIIKIYGLQDCIKLNGLAPWRILSFIDNPNARKEAIKTLFIKEMLVNGVLIQGSHNISYAHNQADIDLVLKAYEKTIKLISYELNSGTLEANLGVDIIMPIFSVRS